MKGGAVTHKLVIPTVPHTLDCFNTAVTPYSNGRSRFYLAPSTTLNPLFVAGVFSFVYKTCNTYDDTVFIINTESLREFLGYSRGGKSKDIRKELRQLASEGCYIDGQAYPLAAVTTEGRLTIIRSDYFHYLSGAMRTYAVRPDGTEGSRYTSKLIERRGSHSAAPVHIAVKTLVARCPSLRRELNTATTNSRRNQILRCAVVNGVQLLTSHTTITTEYAELSVSLPGKISLVDSSAFITVTHKGKIFGK